MPKVNLDDDGDDVDGNDDYDDGDDDDDNDDGDDDGVSQTQIDFVAPGGNAKHSLLFHNRPQIKTDTLSQSHFLLALS